MGVLRILAPLPLPWLLRLGRGIGWFVFHVVPVRRAVTETNLRLCFPEMSERERRRVALRCYQSMGMGAFEALYSCYCSTEELRKHFTIEGIEHMEQARRDRRGVLLFCAHFHTLEIGGHMIGRMIEGSAFYRAPNNPVFAKVLEDARRRSARRLFAVDNMKAAILALRGGEGIWYAPDQAKSFKDTEIVPFFGVPAVTNAATGKIAKLGRALVIPYSVVRTSPNGHYRARIGAPVDGFDGSDPVAEANKINRLIESLIREAPEQYLWQHKRFKGRGERYPDPYAGMR